MRAEIVRGNKLNRVRSNDRQVHLCCQTHGSLYIQLVAVRTAALQLNIESTREQTVPVAGAITGQIQIAIGQSLAYITHTSTGQGNQATTFFQPGALYLCPPLVLVPQPGAGQNVTQA